MDNINDILRAKRIVRQNGYTIKKPARDYDYEREDRMNLIRAKRIVKDAGYSYTKPNDGVTDNADDFDTVPTRRRYQDDVEPRTRRRAADDFVIMMNVHHVFVMNSNHLFVVDHVQ